MTENTTPQKLILVIEDADADYESVVRAFSKFNSHSELMRFDEGEKALAYLQNQKKERPSLILLDLNLPGTDGREILKVIKTHAQLKKVPVIILTTSSNPTDIEQCYEMGANSYMQKPVDFAEFTLGMQRLHDYWFETVILPGPTDGT